MRSRTLFMGGLMLAAVILGGCSKPTDEHAQKRVMLQMAVVAPNSKFHVTKFVRTNARDLGDQYEIYYRAWVEFPEGVDSKKPNSLMLGLAMNKGVWTVTEGKAEAGRFVLQVDGASSFMKTERGWMLIFDEQMYPP